MNGRAHLGQLVNSKSWLEEDGEEARPDSEPGGARAAAAADRAGWTGLAGPAFTPRSASHSGPSECLRPGWTQTAPPGSLAA